MLSTAQATTARDHVANVPDTRTPGAAESPFDGGSGQCAGQQPGAGRDFQDTQSQTAIVLGPAPRSSWPTTIPAPSSLANPSTLGYSVSADGGASFTDQGTLPRRPVLHARRPDPGAEQQDGDDLPLHNHGHNVASGLNFLADRSNVFRSTTTAPPRRPDHRHARVRGGREWLRAELGSRWTTSPDLAMATCTLPGRTTGEMRATRASTSRAPRTTGSPGGPAGARRSM